MVDNGKHKGLISPLCFNSMAAVHMAERRSVRNERNNVLGCDRGGMAVTAGVYIA
jgi:hypothetical protein